MRSALIALALCATGAANAGDLDVLPLTERGFQEKIGAMIKPGGDTEAALRLLEAHRFECREFDHHKNPLFHCSRMNAPQFYQVMIESRNARIRTVESSVGRMSR